MNKEEITKILEEIADLLELSGENPFKVRAYRNAARALFNLEENLELLIKENRLIEVEGIGESIAEKITTLTLKGNLPFYQKLKKSVPQGLRDLLEIQGLGPKKIQQLYKALHITSMNSLKRALKQGKVRTLPGFGILTEKNLLEAIELREIYQKRHLWIDGWQLASSILTQLKKVKEVIEAEIAGSLRRKLETIGDLDFVIASSSPKIVMNWFLSQPFITKVFSKGKTKANVLINQNFKSDIRIVSKDEYPFALLYFTGSKQHTIELRTRAQKRGWTLSEYTLTAKRGIRPPFIHDKKPRSEKEIYALFKLPYIPCELRENLGEFQAAQQGSLPHLIEEKDLRGAFHIHTSASDGKNSLKEMITAAENLGWEYIGISDHSKSSIQANGLSEERLEQQLSEIRALNKSKKFNLEIFSGIECDILSNGSLDFSDSLLKKLDFVIASIHSSLQQDGKAMTKRLIRAIEHPYTTMLGHITGRLLLRRESCSLNLSKVIDACIANKKIIELNGHPARLDMDWRFWHKASERGLLCCINPDAHAVDQLLYVRTGINIARKGWLEKRHVLNTRSLKEVKTLLNK